MKQTNKTKIIADRIAYLGLFLLFIVVEAYYILRLTGNNNPLFLVWAAIAILAIGFIAIAITTKKYGPYREKDEEAPPLSMIFIMVFIINRVMDMFFGKADMIAEAATDFTTAILQITGLLGVCFMLIFIVIRAEMHLEKKYNQWKKQKELDKADSQ